MNLVEKLRKIIEEVFPQKEYSIEDYNDGFKMKIAVEPTIIIVVNVFNKAKISIKIFSVNTEVGFLKVYDLDFLKRILKNYEFFQ